ncbi:hypothetical protein NPIL_368251 [Nephila pilipes]|uniref:Uncharacterized protein n=1 Tax=Nephila pilipes TaxID=299642 RepID=A0A8X6QUH7_NEPPI|nr:hypothetical protein NPIL_368251 [Nephila pilipes]
MSITPTGDNYHQGQLSFCSFPLTNPLLGHDLWTIPSPNVRDLSAWEGRAPVRLPPVNYLMEARRRKEKEKSFSHCSRCRMSNGDVEKAIHQRSPAFRCVQWSFSDRAWVLWGMTRESVEESRK